MTKKLIILLLILTATGACARIETLNAANDFESNSKKYNQMLRWHEMSQAGLTYADDSLKAAFFERARAAKNVNITDYRVIYQECTPEKKTARVIIEMDYYIPPSVTVKTLEYDQQWQYVEINEKKYWKLMTLLPEFK